MFRVLKLVLNDLFFPEPPKDRWAELAAKGLNPVLMTCLHDDGEHRRSIVWTADPEVKDIVRDFRQSRTEDYFPVGEW